MGNSFVGGSGERADISNAEKGGGFSHREKWRQLGRAEQGKTARAGMRGKALRPEVPEGLHRKGGSSNEVGPTAKVYGMRS